MTRRSNKVEERELRRTWRDEHVISAFSSRVTSFLNFQHPTSARLIHHPTNRYPSSSPITTISLLVATTYSFPHPKLPLCSLPFNPTVPQSPFVPFNRPSSPHSSLTSLNSLPIPVHTYPALTNRSDTTPLQPIRYSLHPVLESQDSQLARQNRKQQGGALWRRVTC